MAERMHTTASAQYVPGAICGGLAELIQLTERHGRWVSVRRRESRGAERMTCRM